MTIFKHHVVLIRLVTFPATVTCPHRTLQRWTCDVPEVRLDSSLVNRWVSQQQQSLHHPRVWLTWSFTWMILCFAFIFSSKYTHKLCFPSFSASLSVSSISSYGLQAFVISSHFLCEYLPRVSGPCGCPDQSHTYWATFAWKNCFRFYPFFYESALKVQFFLLLSPWGSFFMSIQLIFSCDNPFCYRQTTKYCTTKYRSGQCSGTMKSYLETIF